MTTKDTSGKYQYKVWGPPWSRKIIKLKVWKKANVDLNNVNRGKKDFNGADVHKFAVLPKLNCFYTNADQLLNKITELEVRSRDARPNIIGITKVKPKHNRYRPAEYTIGDYKMYAQKLDAALHWQQIRIKWSEHEL